MKVAILIPYREEPLFRSIRERFVRRNIHDYEGFSFEFFYIEGRPLRKSELEFRNGIEKLRYSKLWPLLNLWDKFVLSWADKKLSRKYISFFGDTIKVDLPDDLRHLTSKVMSALDYLQNNKEFDIYIRTTQSSLFNLGLLVDEIERMLSNQKKAGGRVVKFSSSNVFLSGSYMILTRNCVRNLLERRFELDHSKLDDVAMSELMNFNTEVHEFSSMEIRNERELEKLPLDDIQKYSHFRCKSDEFPRRDLEIIANLCYKLSSLRIDYI